MKLLEGPSEPEYMAFDQCYFVVIACQLKFEASVAFPIVVAVDQAETGTVTSYVAEVAEAGSAETEAASNPLMAAEHAAAAAAAVIAELPLLAATYAFFECLKHQSQFQEAAAAAAADADLTYFPGGAIAVAGARAQIAGSTSVASVAYSKDYLTEWAAQHHSVDLLTDFVANLIVGPLMVVVVVAKVCWTVELAEFAAKKTADAWRTVDVAAASLQTVQAAGVMIAQIVVLSSKDYVECHSEQLTAWPWAEFVKWWTAQTEGQMTFASWAAVKIASVSTAIKIAAAECVVA